MQYKDVSEDAYTILKSLHLKHKLNVRLMHEKSTKPLNTLGTRVKRHG